jgi:hypothetical protein
MTGSSSAILSFDVYADMVVEVTLPMVSLL